MIETVGVVSKDQNGYFTVISQNTSYQCKSKGRLRQISTGILVGDRVKIDITNQNSPMIFEVLPRTSVLQRPRVANVSQVLVVTSVIQPTLNRVLFDKILLMCANNHLLPLICLTKADLDPVCTYQIASEYRAASYEVVISRHDTEDAKQQLSVLLKDRVTVVCGPSGVGKSSILNKLAGHDIFETQRISQRILRGKNTTRHAELVEIIPNTFVIDTPGFGNVESFPGNITEIMLGFPEFSPFLGKCRFDNCIHDSEPQCAIKSAVTNGDILPIRYQSYIFFLKEWQANHKERFK